ncbi:uncharacterized protein V6R79_006334 [Siganus canaliculatus]
MVPVSAVGHSRFTVALKCKTQPQKENTQESDVHQRATVTFVQVKQTELLLYVGVFSSIIVLHLLIL